MSRLSKDIDSAFQGVGTKSSGLEIWCVYNNQLVSIPKSSFGKFYSGNAYLVLSTVLPKIGSPLYDIHYWLGNDANEVDSVLASDKALELDAALGCCTVQYREVQGQETEKFLSYFKPCIIPVEGKYSPKAGLAGETYQVTLLSCKGDHVVRVKEVPFLRSSLNHDDVFILDTASKVFLFAGCNSSTQEKAKALEVVEYIKDNKHDGRCEVATIEDGKFSGDSDAGEFWSFFGGYAPIPKLSSSSTQEQTQTTCAQLFWIDTRGNLHPTGTGSLDKDVLEKNKCYMLDCYSGVFVWMGRNTSLTERKTSISSSEEFLRNEGRSTSTSLVLLTEGLENAKFRSLFNKWPQTVESSLYNEGREKVAAMFKQKGYDVEELPDEEDELPYANSQGTLKVWRVDGDEVSLLSIPDQTKLFSGDCYIVHYKYNYNEKTEHLLYLWIGCESIQEDRADAITNASAIVGSIKGESVLCHIYQGNEPSRFFPMFQSLVVFKGGLSRRYKVFLAEKADKVEEYDEKKASLFRVQGTSRRNMQAIQVNLAATSLNSSYSYILQYGASAFTWIGKLSSDSDHDVLDRMLYFLDTSCQPIYIREGNEPDTFWDLLGGKSEYPKEKEMRKQIEEPHLFTCSSSSGNDLLKVKEIYNFVQDDLTTEDVLLLDCQSEVYVWIGLNSNIKSKQEALTLGLKFLQMDIMEEGLTVRTPVYVVTEGHEPPFFTRFFDWVPEKANMHGNSFERKLASLKGKKTSTKRSGGSPWSSRSKDNASRGLQSRSVSSNRSERGVSPCSSEKLSSLSSAEDRTSSSNLTPVVKKLFSESLTVDPPSDGLARQESSSNSEISKENPLGGINCDLSSLESLAYSYEQLRVDSQEPVIDIDATRREAYLTKKEFEERFGMAKSDFYALPKWKQNKLKMSLHLF
ncbi:villin-1 isoform X1 [Capsella rubella]|uniref:villin-1 isoform X1 n=1 Tax=Capsella rubella TaxID=81985 RepID=UPI000CD51551|nr:villin-1 isoform X1 [Capsella rubella]XP_023640602.1 villin-1 isoform X1 [Capsella rubella]